MNDFERVGDMPAWMKWGLTIFNRAGFPTLAFALICYICFVTIKDQTRAIEEFKNVLSQMTESIDRNTQSVQTMTQALYRVHER